MEIHFGERINMIGVYEKMVKILAEKKPKSVKAGGTVGPGKYVCIDCGAEYELNKAEQDLRKCPACSCEEYQCFPMTHIRPDIKTPEDAKNPPKKREYLKK
jgi:NAD-dependent SIR2 family protein deacetylase